MHERTQRAIARMMFVFCCALPTAITMLVIVTTWTPWWHRRCLASIEADLSRQTGLVVRIDEFKRAAPSTISLYGVGVFEPETGREVASVREIRWARRGDEVSMLLQQPQLQSSELPHTWKMIHDRFLCRPDQTSGSVQFAANDLTIQSKTGPLTLVDVDAWIRPGLEPNTVEASIQCLPAAAHMASLTPATPISIIVTRQRDGDEPSTSWVLNAGETALPCSALAEYMPQLESLGSDATFAGTMAWTSYRDGWTIDLGGSRFEDISLGQWCEALPHRLTGTAAMILDRCRVSSRKQTTEVIDIAGSLRARDGLVGPSLLMSAREHLGFAVAEFTEPVIGYDRLSLGFNLKGPLLQLVGICGTEIGFEALHSDVVLCAGGQALAESDNGWIQAARLQSLFAPEHSVMVPLSRQTSPLLNLLTPPSRPTTLRPSNPPRIRTATPLQEEPSIYQPN